MTGVAWRPHRWPEVLAMSKPASLHKLRRHLSPLHEPNRIADKAGETGAASSQSFSGALRRCRLGRELAWLPKRRLLNR